jgi:hypothetical protein
LKRLIYVPVIHTEADMGSVAEPLKREYIQRYGPKKWQEHINAIHSMWQGIRQRIFTLGLEYKRTKVYQDGLPVCDKELAIASDLAEAGNENYKIISELLQRGAKLLGTEDPELLLEEYSYIKDVAKIDNLEEKERAIKEYEKKARDLLERRDQYIADRITKTLMEGEVGLLFIGMRHQVDEKLPQEIEVSYLIYRLPFKESFKIQGKL